MGFRTLGRSDCLMHRRFDHRRKIGSMVIRRADPAPNFEELIEQLPQPSGPAFVRALHAVAKGLRVLPDPSAYTGTEGVRRVKD